MKQNNLFKIILSMLIIAVLSSFSCITTPVGIAESNIPLNNKPVSELGESKGNSSLTFSILGLWMIDKPDIKEAVTEAIDSKSGHAITNVRIYNNYIWFVLFGINYVTVEGDVIKFENIESQEEVQ